MTKTVHVRIEGRVQGVGYRAWTVAMARELGLSGWVRNRREGWVEAVFSGNQKAVNAMIESCYEGPPAARVTAIKTSDSAEKVEELFESRPTV